MESFYNLYINFGCFSHYNNTFMFQKTHIYRPKIKITLRSQILFNYSTLTDLTWLILTLKGYILKDIFYLNYVYCKVFFYISKVQKTAGCTSGLHRGIRASARQIFELQSGIGLLPRIRQGLSLKVSNFQRRSAE